MQSAMTITEALQHTKTLHKRIEKKREFIVSSGILYRQGGLIDPHAKSGGSAQLIEQERQAVDDLEKQVVDIRRAIDEANARTTVVVCNISKSIAEWLIWRREIATPRKRFLEGMYKHIQAVHAKAHEEHLGVTEKETTDHGQVIINVNERAVAEEIEQLEEILSTLDGQLSMKNATTTI